MLYIQIPPNSKIVEKIKNFYISLYKQRLYSNSKVKITKSQVANNIKKSLSFIGKQFDDSVLKRTNLSKWEKYRLYEIKYGKWHLGVIVQLDMFGNNIAFVQDCVHDKDYHNDTMQTSPFEMDSPNDKSHLVDWKEYRLDRLISESIKNSINKIMKLRN